MHTPNEYSESNSLQPEKTRDLTSAKQQLREETSKKLKQGIC